LITCELSWLNKANTFNQTFWIRLLLVVTEYQVHYSKQILLLRVQLWAGGRMMTLFSAVETVVVGDIALMSRLLPRFLTSLCKRYPILIIICLFDWAWFLSLAFPLPAVFTGTDL
jgi:hypothetical protein